MLSGIIGGVITAVLVAVLFAAWRRYRRPAARSVRWLRQRPMAIRHRRATRYRAKVQHRAEDRAEPIALRWSGSDPVTVRWNGGPPSYHYRSHDSYLHGIEARWTPHSTSTSQRPPLPLSHWSSKRCKSWLRAHPAVHARDDHRRGARIREVG